MQQLRLDPTQLFSHESQLGSIHGHLSGQLGELRTQGIPLKGEFGSVRFGHLAQALQLPAIVLKSSGLVFELLATFDEFKAFPIVLSRR